MALDDTWFSEICEEGGSAFSLKIRRKLHDERSDYQRIEVYETARFGNLMVIDGFVMLSSRDNFIYHEMMAHPALFTHPAPRRVVIIGGGDCGTLREVLKHDTVEQATLVDIDERVTRVSEQFFPELCSANDDPRARFDFSDGLRWLADAAPGSVDVILVDGTDPVGPGAALYTEAFYANCHRALAADGLMAQQSESPLYHPDLLRTMHTRMQGAGFDGVRTLHFPQPTYPSGWWTATLAGKGGVLDSFRAADAAAKPFPTDYYNAAIHQAAAAAPEGFRRLIGG